MDRSWKSPCGTTLLVLVHVGAAGAIDPPFAGTAFLHTDIITQADVSMFDSMTYSGQGNRLVFDRRENRWIFQPMHLFDATFGDGLTSEIQVNPSDFSTEELAAAEADKYGQAVGRLPTSMRTHVDSITIHKGLNPFGGGNNNILIHTDQAIQYGKYLEEVLFHEAAHTSFDDEHASSPGWLTAQQNDPTFISTYARSFPNREDVAESLLPWYALRYTDVLFPFQIEAIQEAIPNRLAYFDALPFQLNPGPGIPGDYNNDGAVDAADYLVWLSTLGSITDLRADGSGNGVVGGEDYDFWKSQLFAATVTTSSQTSIVPEPSIGAVVVLLLIGWMGRTRYGRL